ncbi:MAG: hypothetical protein JKY08_10305 [Flavobacteriaceae bacterium]|nr:hypothetical protein [Flavobacteriaceae bacterium]
MEIENVKRSEITNFKAEVFFEELQFMLDGKSEREFWVKNHGMNSRSFSKDVLDVSSEIYATDEEVKEAVFIHLSRNSIYHQLPEVFFHPLSISNPTMSNREIVEAIKENKKVEDANIKFFIPFDTALFIEKCKLSNRYLSIFTDDYSRSNLFSLAKKIIQMDIPLRKEQLYKLFLNLCNSEKFKENLPELEVLLAAILGDDISLEYKRKTLLESPFKDLGPCILGYNFGTKGPVISEQDDILATIIMDKSPTYKVLLKNISIIKKILSFFVFSNREVDVQYRFTEISGFLLGENHLGFDTITLKA